MFERSASPPDLCR